MNKAITTYKLKSKSMSGKDRILGHIEGFQVGFL